ncbi:MAG TPA: hypothetical protein VJG90_00285, partial [Candidatus Nanoarchaeia archaeon]|nr:hypothetical protein [Candidatus Nanoarchaeia archaeon]
MEETKTKRIRQTKEFLLSEAQDAEFFNVDEKALKDRAMLQKAKQYATEPELLPEQREALTEHLNDYISRG